MSTEELIIIWEAPKIVAPEFRLYYNDKGHVLCYSCEKLEGNYIVIDSTTYAEARPDIRVIDGKIVRSATNVVIEKLVPNTNEGTICSSEDVSIIVNYDFTGKTTRWKLNLYEL